ncbi:MAG: FkbM family methyltransferase, partial [Desulfovibrio sp.]|nr:FkbM family methyltransferase [Desulfovibrio sp.]
GAEETIRRFRPKLVICLYHRPEDLVTLPLFVKSLVADYRLEVAHASCGFTDTILYAEAPRA